MVDVPFPLLSAPGKQTQTAGGRLVNCYPEKLPATAGKPYAYWRAPGLASFGTTATSSFRGSLLVGSTLYAVVGNKAYSFTSAGGAGTALTGTVNGTARVFMARNNAATPDIVIVSPGDGAQIISGGNVASYPDVDVLQPNSVKYHKGVFNFTYGDGTVLNSDVDALTINALNNATAESKPDTLYCSMPLGNGQLLQAGSSSIEVWGGQNDTGYLFSYIATIPRGIVGPYAIAGDQDGWGKGIFLVGDDYRVSRLDGYAPVPISTTEIDKLIEAEEDKAEISVSVYVAGGHGFVAVQGEDWCWVFDTTLQTWHERQSYLRTDWRAMSPIQAFGKWLCGDKLTGNILQIDALTQSEVSNPLRMRIETGPMGAFPSPVRVNGIEIYCTKGVGIATGTDPVQTDPDVEISCSRDGGQTWTNPRLVKVGRQALTDGRVRSSIWGQAQNQGVRWRFDESSDVPFAFMGADMQVSPLR